MQCICGDFVFMFYNAECTKKANQSSAKVFLKINKLTGHAIKYCPYKKGLSEKECTDTQAVEQQKKAQQRRPPMQLHTLVAVGRVLTLTLFTFFFLFRLTLSGNIMPNKHDRDGVCV